MSQRETHMVEESRQELFEDPLGVALIKPGDSVIIIKKVACARNVNHMQLGWNHGNIIRICIVPE